MLNKIREYRHKRHVDKYGNKNVGYFNVFNKEWFIEHQNGLLFLLNNFILKYYFRFTFRIHKDLLFSEDIDLILPNTFRVKLKNNQYRSDFRTHNKFSKRIYYSFFPIWWVMHFIDWMLLDRAELIPSFGFDILTVYPDSAQTNPDDGISKQDVTWSTARDAFSGSLRGGTTCYLQVTTTYLIERFFINFDTSILSIDATINSGIFSMYHGTYTDINGTPNFRLYNSTASDNIIAEDFDLRGNTLQSDANVSVPADNSYIDYVLNSVGIGYISLIGKTKYSALESTFDVANIPATANNGIGISTSDSTGISQDPKLTVTYTLPASGQQQQMII